MNSIRIKNPYQSNGDFYKAQLHLHTSASIDVWKRIPVEVTIRRYKEAGYRFVVITDHDRVTDSPSLNSNEFLAIPGVEETVVKGLWPLGKHLIRIGVSGRKKNENFLQDSNRRNLFAPSHPNWPGNFWTGRWTLNDLSKLPDLRLIEIYNRHSSSDKDVFLWHQLLVVRGPKKPVWGIAVDDTDNGTPLDLGWIMVKTAEITRNAFLDALYQGSFYATCGPIMEIDVKDDFIQVSAQTNSAIRFINGSNRIVAEYSGLNGTYRPQLEDVFVRIELTDPKGKKAWSQPFFIIND